MNEEIKAIKIDLYLKGEFNALDLANFEADLKADKDLQLEVLAHQQLKEAFEYRKDLLALRHSMEKIEREMDEPQKEKTSIKKIVAAITIFLSLIVTAFLIYKNSVHQSDSEPRKNQSEIIQNQIKTHELLRKNNQAMQWQLDSLLENLQKSTLPQLNKKETIPPPIAQKSPQTSKSIPQNTDKNQLIAMDYYSPSPLVSSTVRDKEEGIDSLNLLQQAENRYQAQDYKNALVKFEQLLTKQPKNVRLLFYAGNCYLHPSINRPKSAIDAFQVVINHNDNIFLDKAEWYLALTYLKQNEAVKAKLILQQIQNIQGHEKGKEATILLNTIKK